MRLMRCLVVSVLALLSCGRDGFEPGGEEPPPPPPVRKPGEFLWAVPFPGRGLASFDDSTAFFLGRAHNVIAVDKRTGRERWRQVTGAPGAGTLGFGTVVAGGHVVVTDVHLHAFDRRTGAPAWHLEAPDRAVLAQSIPVAHRDTVFAGTSDGHFVAIDGADGRLLWRVRPVPGDTNVAYDPVYAGGRVYACLASKWMSVLVALESGTGRTVWARPIASVRPLKTARCLGWAAVSGGLVMVTTENDGYVRAFDVRTGAPVWTAPNLPTDLNMGDIRFGVAVGSMLVVGSSQGIIQGLDLATGAERWRTETGFGSAVDPLVADDSLVFVNHAGGRLAALRAATGAVAWRACDPFPASGQCNYVGAVDTDRLYHAGFEAVYAIKK